MFSREIQKMVKMRMFFVIISYKWDENIVKKPRGEVKTSILKVSIPNKLVVMSKQLFGGKKEQNGIRSLVVVFKVLF